MEHSIALVSGTTSGLGYAAARMLAIEGYRQVIVTGRSLAPVSYTHLDVYKRQTMLCSLAFKARRSA